MIFVRATYNLAFYWHYQPRLGFYASCASGGHPGSLFPLCCSPDWSHWISPQSRHTRMHTDYPWGWVNLLLDWKGGQLTCLTKDWLLTCKFSQWSMTLSSKQTSKNKNNMGIFWEWAKKCTYFCRNNKFVHKLSKACQIVQTSQKVIFFY